MQGNKMNRSSVDTNYIIGNVAMVRFYIIKLQLTLDVNIYIRIPLCALINENRHMAMRT